MPASAYILHRLYDSKISENAVVRTGPLDQNKKHLLIVSFYTHFGY